MTTLFGYIFKQTALPVLFFTVALTMMIWLTQSLKMLDLIISGGQSFLTFFHLVILVLPSMLTVILPISLFCGVLYGLHRLYSESEIVVMWSAGLGRWRLLSPIMALAFLVMAVNYILGLYLMPLGYRAMKDRIYEIRTDLAASFVREGQFTSKIKGLTVYIASAPSRADLKGILVHDNRRKGEPRTYMAERGMFVRTPEGPRLVMEKGQVQEMANRNGQLQVLKFDSTILDLGQFVEASKDRNSRDLNERYLGELFDPPGDMRDRKKKRLVAEGHNRLASPLYTLAFVMIAYIAVVCGVFSRRGYSMRIVAAMAAIISLRLLGFAVQSAGSTTPAWNVMQYAIPLAAILVAAMMIGRVPPFHRTITLRLGSLLPFQHVQRVLAARTGG